MALQLITMNTAGEILSLNEQTIRRYVATGKLRGYRCGPRALRVDRGDVEALAQPIPVTDPA